MDGSTAAGISSQQTVSDTQEAFVALVQEHKKLLFKIASAYCRDPLYRDDLTQEIVAQLWRSFHRYDGRSKFSTWMYRVSLNVAISFSRQETRRAKHAISGASALLESLPAGEPIERDERLGLLERFIAHLAELDRALIVLYLEGKHHAEIASILGISETNVATKIGRIKQQLRAGVRADRAS